MAMVYSFTILRLLITKLKSRFQYNSPDLLLNIPLKINIFYSKTVVVHKKLIMIRVTFNRLMLFTQELNSNFLLKVLPLEIMVA